MQNTFGREKCEDAATTYDEDGDEVKRLKSKYIKLKLNWAIHREWRTKTIFFRINADTISKGDIESCVFFEHGIGNVCIFLLQKIQTASLWYNIFDGLNMFFRFAPFFPSLSATVHITKNHRTKQTNLICTG